MFKIKLTSKAKKELKNLSKEDKLSIAEIIEDLKENQLLGKVLDRDLKNKFSYRVGVYRIIYKVDQKDKIVEVISAGHRSTFYNK